jgi:hypothetical protein
MMQGDEKTVAMWLLSLWQINTSFYELLLYSTTHGTNDCVGKAKPKWFLLFAQKWVKSVQQQKEIFQLSLC